MTTKNDSKPIKIAITGSEGLIGWHLRVFLFTKANNSYGSAESIPMEVVGCNRSQFNDDEYLSSAVGNADVVVHLAGMNRGDEDMIAKVNVELAERLAQFLKKTNSTPQVIYSSSTHADGNSRYGVSKRTAGERLAQWAAETGGKFCNLILPHVFGEHGKPFYNSVVSTFAHQLANGETPHIDNDGQLCLLHCQDVAAVIWEKITSGFSGEARPEGTPVKVSEMLGRLQRLVTRYQEGAIPNLDDPLDLRLFNTWRSYLPHEARLRDLTVHADNRGDLFEVIRVDGEGQVFLSTTHPGVTRGDHFHTKKVERFLVLSGKAKIRLRKVMDDNVFTYEVDGTTPQAIDIPTLHSHNITNVGDEPLVALFWAGEHFDVENSDTCCLPVALPSGQKVNS